MSVRSDYPELVRISNGMGVHILEDAEDQARRALDELARLRGENPQREEADDAAS